MYWKIPGFGASHSTIELIVDLMKGFVDGSFECELYTTFDVNINSLPEFLFGYATQYFETQKIKIKSEEI